MKETFELVFKVALILVAIPVIAICVKFRSAFEIGVPKYTKIVVY